MSLPRVYAAINAVATALSASGIAKRGINLDEQYAYRTVDDVFNEIGPLLAAHKLCVLPRVLRRQASERTEAGGVALTHVVMRVAFDFVCVDDGSVHTVEAYGEALDGSDKGTAKAMQSAYKYALLQSFCVPLGAEDADGVTRRLKKPSHEAAPPQGWQQWTSDTCELIRSCESVEALERLQASNRGLLLSLARERRALYELIGSAVAERRTGFAAKRRTPKRERAAAGGKKRAAAIVKSVSSNG